MLGRLNGKPPPPPGLSSQHLTFHLIIVFSRSPCPVLRGLVFRRSVTEPDVPNRSSLSRFPALSDVRVIAATNSDLTAAVKHGTFRADLFYRLNVFPLGVPPLRDRQEDIPLLARHVLGRYCVKFNRSCRKIDQESLERLMCYTWPGNIRELENVIAHADSLSRTAVEDREACIGGQVSSCASSPPSDLSELEHRCILQTLTLTEWHIKGRDGAAVRLGIPPSTLRSRMKQFGMKRPLAK